jgi:anaerobic ribonucleoside-triphosphate reductase activating protein
MKNLQDSATPLRVADIVYGTIVDGPGLRTSIYFAGCAHCCPGCHNPSTWDFAGGREVAVGDLLSQVEREGLNVTLSGGDPVYQAEALLPFVAALCERGIGIWCYTGFTYEEIMEGRAGESALRLLEYVDVLVDGPYVEALRDPSLHFRGSANQRLVDLRRSVPGELVFYDK